MDPLNSNCYLGNTALGSDLLKSADLIGSFPAKSGITAFIETPRAFVQNVATRRTLQHIDSLISVHERGDPSSRRSWATSNVSLPAGSRFASIKDVRPARRQELGTVQAGRNLHVVWNSKMYFANHSCAPSLECDWTRMEIRVCRDRDLFKGDVLSVFYPSTEWTLEHEFDCWCGAGESCCGRIRGARDMDRDVMKKYWLNDYIKNLLEDSLRL